MPDRPAPLYYNSKLGAASGASRFNLPVGLGPSKALGLFFAPGAAARGPPKQSKRGSRHRDARLKDGAPRPSAIPGAGDRQAWMATNHPRGSALMTTTIDAPAKPAMNGVNTPMLLATINAVGAQPELAAVPVPRPLDVGGRHPQPHHRRRLLRRRRRARATRCRIVVDADHPAVLVGGDNGPTPVEFLLQGLAACLTAGIGNIAAVRGISSRGRGDRRGRHRPAGHPRPQRPRSATATRRSAPASASAATRPPRSSPPSSSSRRPARPSSTC